MPRKATKPTLIAADDDIVVRRLIGHAFEKAGLKIDLVEEGQALLDAVDDSISVVLVDLNMPKVNGMECLRSIKKEFPFIEVIILTHVNEAKDALEAMKEGAFDYITKPFDPEELCLSARKAMQLSKSRQENEQLKTSVAFSQSSGDVVGSSEAMKKIFKLANRMAVSDNTVLLGGESGTGKGVMARKIHNASPRAGGPFISVSCPSLPKNLIESELFGHEKGAFSGAIQRRLGKVELAKGGTLFLDEIGELPLDLQPKLLTFLQDKAFFRVGGEREMEADVRIIAATNCDLEAMSKEGSFREDLYFRLNVLPVVMPPLRERAEDAWLLAQYFLGRAVESVKGDSVAFTTAAESAIKSYSWPGNVREIENAIERAFTLREDDAYLDIGDLPTQVREDSRREAPIDTPVVSESLAGKTLKQIEKRAIEETLEFCKGNKAETARMLGITEKSIYNKLKRISEM